MKDTERLDRILSEANKAKEILRQVAQKLDNEGYSRKARTCITLLYKIEEWQNKY